MPCAGAGRFVPVVVEAAPDQEPDAATISPPSESVVAKGQPATGRMEIVLAGDRRSHGRRGGAVARDPGAGAAMIPVPSGVRVWLATWVTDLPRYCGLALFGTAIAYVVFFEILTRAGASNVMLVTLLIPVTARAMRVISDGLTVPEKR